MTTTNSPRATKPYHSQKPKLASPKINTMSKATIKLVKAGAKEARNRPRVWFLTFLAIKTIINSYTTECRVPNMASVSPPTPKRFAMKQPAPRPKM